MSKRVEYDIYESDYYFKVGAYEFYFSSMFNRDRFITKYINFLKEENNKITVKYRVNIDLTEYLLIAFYKKIEKRGFRVLIHKNDDIISLEENYTFNVC